MLEKLIVMFVDDSFEFASSSGISSGIDSQDLSSQALDTSASNSVLSGDSLHLSERSEASLHEAPSLSAPGLIETVQNVTSSIGDFAFGESVYSTQPEFSFSTVNDRIRDASTFLLGSSHFLETRSDGASIKQRNSNHEVQNWVNSVPITGSQIYQENQSLSDNSEVSQRSVGVNLSEMDHHDFENPTEDSSIDTNQNLSFEEPRTTEDHNKDVPGEIFARESTTSAIRKVNHSQEYESVTSSCSLQPVETTKSIFQRFLHALSNPVNLVVFFGLSCIVVAPVIASYKFPVGFRNFTLFIIRRLDCVTLYLCSKFHLPWRKN